MGDFHYPVSDRGVAQQGIHNSEFSWTMLVTTSFSKWYRSQWGEVLCWTFFSTSVEELVRNVLLKVNFASGDYEMAVFKILKAAKSAHSMLITL